MKFFRFIVLCSIIVVVSGCSSGLRMGVTKNTQEIKLSGESLLLMSIDLKNEHSIHYQPEARALSLEMIEVGNTKKNEMYYEFDNEGTTISDQGNKYYVRAILKPGKYIIHGVHGGSGVFPFSGTFFMPLHSEIEVPPSSIIYLGKVTGTVRKKMDGDFRAGRMTPLLDQAATGFSTGTFDVKIQDAFENDLNSMKAVFPALNKASNIEKKILPPFDREFAYKWWDDH